MFTHIARIGFSAIAFAAASEGSKAGSDSEATEAATNLNTAIVPLMDEEKITKIKKLMKSRQVFDSFDAARTALGKVMAGTENAFGVPVAVHGLSTETGEIDQSIYAGDSIKTVLAYVGAKDTTAKITGIKAIVIYPMPTVEAFLESESGRDLVAKTMEKEAALVAFRNFRESATLADLYAGVNKAPATADQYATEHSRGGNGLDTETFDNLWTDIRTAIKKKSPQLSAALPSKPEILNGIRSAQWAKEAYPALESAGVFVMLANIVLDNAKANTTLDEDKKEVPAPMDTQAIDGWLAGRDTFTIERKKVGEFDSSLLAGLSDL